LADRAAVLSPNFTVPMAVQATLASTNFAVPLTAAATISAGKLALKDALTTPGRPGRLPTGPPS
jgi:hypothetical protein